MILLSLVIIYSEIRRMPKKLTTKQFIERSKNIHGDNYDYSLVEYINARTKVKIICKIHGDFKQIPDNHSHGIGCAKCGGLKANKNRIRTVAEFIQESIKLHGFTYDYSLIKQYINNQTKIDIICKKHGIFKKSPIKHLSGQGCPICSKIEANKKISKTKKGQPSKNRKTNEEFIQNARIIHGDIYEYDKAVYITSRCKIIITCDTHGDFLQTPSKHLMGRGCPKCKNQFSKISNEWLDYLNVEEREYRLPERMVIPVDGYDPITNTCYQFHGDFWHGNPTIFDFNDINPLTNETYGDAYKRTLRIENEIKNYGYKLVVIWESEWKEQRKSLLP